LDQAIEENEFFDASGMIYIKSILVGLVAAVLSLILLVAATIFISTREQSSGLGVVVGVVGYPLLVGVIVFAVGFAWEFRRSLRKASPR
jgi:ABC-type spermidine/putrescine transport system permease subunit II